MSEAQETSDFPTTLDTWVTLTDKEDLSEASDLNKMKAAIEALEAEIRIRTNRIGTSFPVSGLYDGYFFYRTDQNVAYIYNGSSWDSQGQSLSNVIFAWSGVDSASNNTHGIYKGTDASIDIGASGGGEYMYLVSDIDSAQTLLRFQFTKIAGISTVTIHARLWSDNASAAQEAILTVDIGGQSNTVKSVTSTTPTWVTTSDIDVSGLSDGATYDGVVQLHNEDTDVTAFCSAVTLIGS